MAYNPSQPRDEDGKWTAEGGSSTHYRQNMPYEEIIAEGRKIDLNFFSKKSEGDAKASAKKEIPLCPVEAFGFSDKHKLKRHYEKHKKNFKFKNETEYNKAAIDFWNKSPGTLYYAEMRNKFCKLGADGLTVCICEGNGTVNSFYVFKNHAEVRFYMELDGWRKTDE